MGRRRRLQRLCRPRYRQAIDGRPPQPPQLHPQPRPRRQRRSGVERDRYPSASLSESTQPSASEGGTNELWFADSSLLLCCSPSVLSPAPTRTPTGPHRSRPSASPTTSTTSAAATSPPT